MGAVVSRMIHRAAIERNTGTLTDDYGHPAPPTWTALNTVKCFANSRAKREVVDGDKIVTVEDLRLMVPLGTDVTEKDRVSNITDAKGTTIIPGPLDVEAVQWKQAYLDVLLEKRAS